MRDLLWWCLISIIGVFFRCFFDVDPYLAAMVLFFQKQKYVKAIFFGSLWILILEGYSDLPFGGILLYYIGISFVYFWLKEFLKFDSSLASV